MSLSPPEPFDDAGMINVHARGSFVGANFEVVETNQATGAVIDLSAVPLFFEIDAIDLRKSLPANPEDTRGRLFPDITSVEVAELAALSPATKAWEVWDESGGHHVPIMRGLIKVYT